MRRKLLAFLLFGLAPLFAACGERVPVEVKTAMEKQAAELQQIRSAYKSSVDALFAQIRVLQLAVLSENEERLRQKYTIGLRVVGDNASYYDKDGNPYPATGKSSDVLPADKNQIITEAFARMRSESEKQLLDTKEEFMKLDDHVEIAQQINVAVSDYITSLVNARNAQRELGNNLIAKLGTIPGPSGLPLKLLNLVIPKTEALENLPQTKR